MRGKVALGPFIGRRGASRVERGHSPPLNSPSLRGVGARSRRPMCEIRWACREPPGRTSRRRDIPGQHKAIIGPACFA